jgi:hypothetical protein
MAGLGRESPLVARIAHCDDGSKKNTYNCRSWAIQTRQKHFHKRASGGRFLPTDVIPLTAVATFIAWRRQPKAEPRSSMRKCPAEAALQVLPESDAAFFVVSADPLITEIELD